MDNKTLRHEILKAIEKNSRLSDRDLAAMLGVEEEVVSA